MKSLLLSAIMMFALATTGCALQNGVGGGACGEPVNECTVLSGDCNCSAPRGLDPSCNLFKCLSDNRGMGLRLNQRGTACNQGRGSGLISRITNSGPIGSGVNAGCSSCGDATATATGCGCGSAPTDAGCGCGGNAAAADCGCAPSSGPVIRRLGDRPMVARVKGRMASVGCNSCDAPAADCGCEAPVEEGCGCEAPAAGPCGCDTPSRGGGLLGKLGSRRDCGCDAPAADCGCEAPAAADCGCEGRVRGGLLGRLGSRGCGCDAPAGSATDCGCEEEVEVVETADCGCDDGAVEGVGGLLGKMGAKGCGCKLGNCLFGGGARAVAPVAPMGGGIIGNGMQGFRGCGSPGCGVGGRPCGGCLSKLRGQGGGIPHTAQGPGAGTGMAPSYAYPYYTTRGPRDFLMKKPPSIGY